MLLNNEVLHRKVTLNGQYFLQLVLHELFEKIFVKRCMMTLGIKTEIGPCHFLSRDFFWPGMGTYTRPKKKRRI